MVSCARVIETLPLGIRLVKLFVKVVDIFWLENIFYLFSENGFNKLEFIGNKKEYIEFITRTGAKVKGTDVFKTLNQFENGTCQGFRVGGADCSYVEQIEKKTTINDCRISDYFVFSVNCLMESSAMFIHCSGYENDLKVGKLVSVKMFISYSE